jgi:hypothetical protein
MSALEEPEDWEELKRRMKEEKPIILPPDGKTYFWNGSGWDEINPPTTNNNISYYMSYPPENKFSKSTEEKIRNVCQEIEELLIEKNRKYGDSAISPVRVFSKADNLEQLKVRIDDKLSRVSSAQLDEDEAVIDDLIGYLVLLKVALR